MCRLKASDVREELVSAAAREAERDFVYGEIKPAARGGFFATSAGWLAGRPVSLGLLAGPEAAVGRRRCWLAIGEGEGAGEEQPGPGPGALRRTPHPALTCYLSVAKRHTPTLLLTHSTSGAPARPFRGSRPRSEEALRLQGVFHRAGETEAAPVPSLRQTHTTG